MSDEKVITSKVTVSEVSRPVPRFYQVRGWRKPMTRAQIIKLWVRALGCSQEFAENKFAHEYGAKQ